MKKMLNKLSWIMMLLLLVAACSPQEDAKYALGSMTPVTADQVSFTITPSAKSPNIVTVTNTTPAKGVFSVLWTLADNKTDNKNSITLTYPEKGDYPIMLTIYNPDGTAVSKTGVIKIANSDFSLVNTPAYLNLTGGTAMPNGKVWVFDQYNNFAKEVATATKLDVKGHMGLGPEGSYGQGWWGAGPNEKNTWKMYDFKFNFIQAGVKLIITNNGEGYGRKASSASVGGFSVSGVNGDDVFFPYSGGNNYSFSIDETGKYPKLKLSGNAFMGYYCGSQEYDIIYQTDKVMALRVDNTVEGQDWVFVYCLQELNVPPPPVVKELKAVPLAENFESAPVVNFVKESMGAISGIVDNPMPLPINESNKVYRYQKSTEFYSNLSFTAATYKFDLTTQNKITLKVYIPSYNDYTTDYAVAGSWISNTKLLPRLAVKLQDSSKGGDAWQTQTEIIKDDLTKDKWLELTYDFSGVANRTDYDKIVIQFGAEGHAGPGIFFFDDFSFHQ